jgi:hypothetical protein
LKNAACYYIAAANRVLRVGWRCNPHPAFGLERDQKRSQNNLHEVRVVQLLRQLNKLG